MPKGRLPVPKYGKGIEGPTWTKVEHKGKLQKISQPRALIIVERSYYLLFEFKPSEKSADLQKKIESSLGKWQSN